MTEHILPRILDSLIQDCITYRFTDTESQEYILDRTGIKISTGHITKKKRKVESEPEITQWLNHHTRIGFVIQHKLRMNEMEKIQEKLLKLFTTENNTKMIILLAERIESVNRRLSELNLGSPIIAKIKSRIENGNNTTGIQTGTEVSTV